MLYSPLLSGLFFGWDLLARPGLAWPALCDAYILIRRTHQNCRYFRRRLLSTLGESKLAFVVSALTNSASHYALLMDHAGMDERATIVLAGEKRLTPSA